MKQVIQEITTSAFEDSLFDVAEAPHCQNANMHVVNSAVSFAENADDLMQTFENIRDTAIYIQEISIEDN